MISRTFDATFLNSVANHPDVRPFIGGEGELDLAPLIEDRANVALVTEHGGWLLQQLLPGVYELHTVFLSEGRGEFYFSAAREALRFMFTQTDCLEILTKCPDDNPGARMAAVKVGFRERFHRDGAWAENVGVSFQALSIHDWIRRDDEIPIVGHEFHEALGLAKIAHGSDLPTHADDEAHDRAVGASFLMARHGFMSKAIGVYNMWAIFAGYAQIHALSETIVDVQDGLVELVNGEMVILGVRRAPA